MVREKLVLLWIALCLLVPSPAWAGDAPETYQWRNLAPPEGAPLKVSVSFHLGDIFKVDDEAETFEFAGVLNLKWKDPRVAFDPEAEGVGEKYFHGDYQFNELEPGWYPQVVVANSAEVADTQGLIFRIRPDGTCFLTRTLHATARTPLDLKPFPFDTQRLTVQFSVLGFDSSRIQLVEHEPALTGSLEALEVPEWSFLSAETSTGSIASSHAAPNNRNSTVDIHFNVARQSFYMVRLVIMPLLVIVMLSWTVFWMDRSTLGDRMSVSFVGILTAVSYQAMVSDIMPQIAYVTFCYAFVSLSFLLMCLTAVINLVVASFDKAGRVAFADRIDIHCRWLFPLVYCLLIGGTALSTIR